MLRKRIGTIAESIGLPWPLRWTISLPESLFLVPTFFMALAFEVFGEAFGKRGIAFNLPAGWGAIPHFQPRLFPMEIYLLWTGILTLTQVRRWPFRDLRHGLVLFTVALLGLGLARAIPDFRQNPLLVARNAAFVWYLALPLMIALFPMRSYRWESFFRLLYLISFFYFTVNLAYPLYVGDTEKVFWCIDMGLLLAMAYGFCSPEKWGARIALVAIGFVLGLAYVGTVQRTTLIGLLLTNFLLLLSSQIFPGNFPRPRWRRAAWLTVGLAACFASVAVMRAHERGSPSVLQTGSEMIEKADPKRRSENTSDGLEKFRYFMWLDAWNLFKSAPVTGIGFFKPVVYRAYFGSGEFYDNTQGSFEQRSQKVFSKDSPPIAGPHNSYLNALARMGIFGIGFLLLHLACLWLFVTRCYFACFFVLFWQILYAFFNVSLEGPIRSFPLLLLIGVGLKLTIEKVASLRGDEAASGEPRKRARARGSSPRKVGLVHVPYRIVGGEDQYVAGLRKAYRDIGIEPVAIPQDGAYGDLLIGAARSLTTGSFLEWDAIVRRHGIEFLHLNNIHAALGPAFLRWIISREIPTLFTVHNHRFYCTNGLALYGTEVCKACRPKPSFLRPILGNCNGSLPKSVYHSAALVEIRGENLLQRAVTRFLAPSPYIAKELAIAGIPSRKIQVFPHAVDVTNVSPTQLPRADVAFVGRLSAEKGVKYLLDAAALQPKTTFAIVGEGPLDGLVREAAAKHPNIRALGKLSPPDALAVMKAAKVVCVPSVCHESFSLVAAEALSLGCRLVVPDSQSFVHYAEAPYGAVPANVTNPESLSYSLTTALELPPRSDDELARIRERFGATGFQDRLRRAVASLEEPLATAAVAAVPSPA
jgi:glycosyltransferase involved in cell wall biosynthesis